MGTRGLLPILTQQQIASANVIARLRALSSTYPNAHMGLNYHFGRASSLILPVEVPLPLDAESRLVSFTSLTAYDAVAPYMQDPSNSLATNIYVNGLPSQCVCLRGIQTQI